MLMPYRFLMFPKFAISQKHYVTVQARLSCFLQSFLSSFGKDVFTEPSTAARSKPGKIQILLHSQLCAHEKRPRRIASSRSFTMRFRLAVFAKIAMDGCALGQFCYSHSLNPEKPKALQYQGFWLFLFPLFRIMFRRF